MKKCIAITAIVVGFCLTALSGWAAVYVSDNLEAPLRSGPGTKYKIVGMLRSGQAVEAISEKEGWTNVRFGKRDDGKEGWILSRYLMNREPWVRRVKVLEAENARLRETVLPMESDLGAVKKRNTDLAAELKEKTLKLETLEKQYENLEKDASKFLELRDAFEKTSSDLTKVQRKLTKTTEENKLLRSSHRHKWFLAGALVLLFGLIIGMITGRREKKRSSRLYL